MKIFVLLSHFVPPGDRGSWETSVSLFSSRGRAEKALADEEARVASDNNSAEMWEFEISEREVDESS